MGVGHYDFTTIGGNSLPIVLRLLGFDGTGSTFEFRCRTPRREVIARSSAGGAIAMSLEPGDGGAVRTLLRFELTAQETRVLGEGRVNRYELGRRIGGSERSILSGFIIASRGSNADV
jgi:hypothetical protein